MMGMIRLNTKTQSHIGVTPRTRLYYLGLSPTFIMVPPFLHARYHRQLSRDPVALPFFRAGRPNEAEQDRASQ